jgi:hypothetical protein
MMSTIKTPPKRPAKAITHEFVELIPDLLAPDTIYISVPFTSAAHNCFCGCGTKVVTPIRPTGWQLLFDGDTVSLLPSIGNWNFQCRSHYWIRNDRVIWALPMTQAEIERGRIRDRRLIDGYFGEQPMSDISDGPQHKKHPSLLARLFRRPRG